MSCSDSACAPRQEVATRRHASPGWHMSMATVVGMAPRTQRRQRGTGGSRVGVFVEVAPDAKHRLDLMQAATGAPRWAIVEALLQQVELDEHGRPVFWPDSANQQEVLDISA